MDEGVANLKGTVTTDSVILSNMHDCLVKFLFNEFIVAETLLRDSKLCLDVSVALPRIALQLVVL